MESPKPRKGIEPKRLIPLILIVVVAAVGYMTLGEYLTFERLGANREALLAFRDANYALTSAAFIGAYVAVVAFSLPGAAVASLTGGFLFGLFPARYTTSWRQRLALPRFSPPRGWGWASTCRDAWTRARELFKKSEMACARMK